MGEFNRRGAVHVRRFPWSLSGGGASEVMAALGNSSTSLGDLLDRPIGFASFPGQDEVFFLSGPWFRQRPDISSLKRALITGDVVRDWDIAANEPALVPYDTSQEPVPSSPAPTGAAVCGPCAPRSDRPRASAARRVPTRMSHGGLGIGG